MRRVCSRPRVEDRFDLIVSNIPHRADDRHSRGKVFCAGYEIGRERGLARTRALRVLADVAHARAVSRARVRVFGNGFAEEFAYELKIK